MGWAVLLGIAMLAGARASPLTVQLRDRQGAPVEGAVVALEQPGLPRRAKAGTEAQLAQRDRQFQPGLLVVQTGTVVGFPNQDKVRHHVYSYSPAKTFELKLYLGEAAPPVPFDQPGVVQLGCNIHDRMSAHIVVVDTPRFAVSDAQGAVRLDRLPGAGTLRVWHAQLGSDALLAFPLAGEAAQQTLSLPLR